METFPGASLGGKYRLGSAIGSGGMGTVYRATHEELGRSVAIKLLRGDYLGDPVIVERFRREAQTVARLRHPYLVTVYDFGVDPGLGAYLVMELLEGRSLRDEIRVRSRLRPGFAVELLRRVCTGVQVAHDASVVHRDLKPDNIFLEATSHGVMPRVLDFGLAKIVAGNSDPAITVGGGILGTPTYMSPEQCEGRVLDVRTDVYSLGCVLYEALTGRPPFLGGSTASVLAMHLRDTPPPPSMLVPSLPAGLDAVVLCALAKEPRDRFDTAEAFGTALAGLDAGAAETELAPEADAPTPLARPVETVAIAPTHARAAAPTNLPQQLTSFVGRGREIAELAASLSSTRALTLTGIGGIGKTRLALRLGTTLLGRHRDGVWLVELAALDDPALVPDAVARALGMPGHAAPPHYEAMCDFLQGKQLLLVLDNCEHLVAACAMLAEALLRAASGLKILSTSRAPLGFAGETVWPVPTLSLPDAAGTSGTTPLSPEQASGFEAVRLFVDRAKQSRPSFKLTDEAAPLVAEICARLDGIPLAIELAAARVKLLSLEQIRSKLEDRFRLLGSGVRSTLRRQHTLRATLDWSHQLLSSDEQRLFGALAVFAGGFTLAAAETICGAVAEGTPAGLEVLDGLSQLADKSLLLVDPEGAEARYRMLETTRSYALEKLDESAESERVRERHRDWFLALAERLVDRQGRRESDHEFSKLAADYDNVRGALQWSVKREADAELTLRLCIALGAFWQLRGHWAEGRRWLDAALDKSRHLGPLLRGRALHWAGVLAGEQGDFRTAIEKLETCLELRREANDERGLALTLQVLAHMYERVGDYARAEELKREGLELVRRLGDPRAILGAINNLALRALYRGDYAEAERSFAEGLAIARRIDDKPNTGVQLHNLGETLLRRGDVERAIVLLEESIAVARSIDAKRIVAYSSHLLASALCDRGDPSAPLALLREALDILRDEGDKDGLAYVLDGLAAVAGTQGSAARALRLWGAASALRQSINAILSPPEQAIVDRRIATQRAAIGDAEAERLLADGRSMELRDAVRYALEVLT